MIQTMGAPSKMFMNERTYILNPDYHFKNDVERVTMFSKRQVKYDSSADWLGFVHPTQAMLLGTFTTDEPFEKHCVELAEHFGTSVEKIQQMLSPYLANPEPVYTEAGDHKVYFPKNVLIPIETLGDKTPEYDFTLDDFRCGHVDLTPDRTHRAPHSLLFMVTNKCVTNCAYCYADRHTRHKPMTTEQTLHLIDEAHRLKMSYIDVIGGELFCLEDWDVILKRLVDYDMSPSYISTKVPVTEEFIRRLEKTGYRDVVQLSLDSLDEPTLKRIIHCADGYIERVKHGAELLQAHGFKIEVDTILTKYNCDHRQLDDLYHYIKGIHNLRYWEVRVPEMSLYNRETFSAVKASRGQLEDITKYVREKIIPQAGITIYVSDEALTEPFQQGASDVPNFRGGSCGILQNRMFVLPDGKATLCEQLYWHPDFIIGDLTKQTFEDVCNSEKAKKIFNAGHAARRAESPCTGCKIYDFCKEHRRKCVVKVMKAYGMDNWDFPDPRCKYAPEFSTDLRY